MHEIIEKSSTGIREIRRKAIFYLAQSFEIVGFGFFLLFLWYVNVMSLTNYLHLRNVQNLNWIQPMAVDDFRQVFFVVLPVIGKRQIKIIVWVYKTEKG